MITVSTVMVSAPASSTMSWPIIRREAKLVPGRTVRTEVLGAVTSSSLPHPVSDTAHRGDEPCGLSRLVELPAEVGDVHVDEMVIPDPAVAQTASISCRRLKAWPGLSARVIRSPL